MGEWLKRKVNIGGERFTEGLVSAFLLFCIGSMTILGSIEEGVGHTPKLLYTKAALDLCSSAIFASTFGVGVIFSIIPLFIFQGTITLFASSAQTFFTPEVIGGISATGGIMLIGLGIDILEIKKISIANMLPALVIVSIILYYI